MVSTILDVSVNGRSLEAMTADSVAAIEKEGPQIIFACANPHSLVVAQSDHAFKAALTGANHVVADGVGVTIMARLVGVKTGPRITGHDYFGSVMDALQQRGRGRIFFFGSSPHVLDLITKRFIAQYPSLTLCGTLSPPFRPWSKEENDRMIEKINNADPEILWVGMTAPKQEKWVEANRHQLNIPVIGSIGAVFDFFAGTYPRAPEWACRAGLEWAYRFIKEPRRMWQRNIVSTPKFIALVLSRHLFASSK
jgi:N-acetylglucosaminyldiphosphoundecaprenol N-acetyl-beta-D-mannosaminyltransferase